CCCRGGGRGALGCIAGGGWGGGGGGAGGRRGHAGPATLPPPYREDRVATGRLSANSRGSACRRAGCDGRCHLLEQHADDRASTIAVLVVAFCWALLGRMLGAPICASKGRRGQTAQP